MGWTSFYVGTGYDNRARKNYLDKGFSWTPKDKDGNVIGKNEVLKSAMVGSTYYAAVRATRNDGYDKTFAVITLTRVENGEFFYKDMSEDSGPYECKCPKGIFNLLSPLDDDQTFAKEWRKRVEDYYSKHTSSNKVKVGNVYKCKASHQIEWNGDYKINKDEDFFVKYCDFGKRRKYYLIAKKCNDGSYSTVLKRINLSTFNNCNPILIGNYA